MNTKSPVYTRTCQDETRAPPLQLTQVTPGIPFSSSEGTTSFTYVHIQHTNDLLSALHV